MFKNTFGDGEDPDFKNKTNKQFFNDPKYMLLYDRKIEAFNNLSDKLAEANIDIKYLYDLVIAVEKHCGYEYAACNFGIYQKCL